MRMILIISLLLGTFLIAGVVIGNKIVGNRPSKDRSGKDFNRFVYRAFIYDTPRYQKRKLYANRNDIPNHIMRKKVSSRRHSQYIDKDYR